eukprot:641292-Hanusia_phi.AAC.1
MRRPASEGPVIIGSGILGPPPGPAVLVPPYRDGTVRLSNREPFNGSEAATGGVQTEPGSASRWPGETLRLAAAVRSEKNRDRQPHIHRHCTFWGFS